MVLFLGRSIKQFKKSASKIKKPLLTAGEIDNKLAIKLQRGFAVFIGTNANNFING